jgi:hypothetical protein
VVAGNARIFRCLVANLGEAGFGSMCRIILIQKLQRRQENWLLDFNLHAECKQDAKVLCANVDHERDTAETMRCLMEHHDELAESCLREVCRFHLKCWYCCWMTGVQAGKLHEVCTKA